MEMSFLSIFHANFKSMGSATADAGNSTIIWPFIGSILRLCGQCPHIPVTCLPKALTAKKCRQRSHNLFCHLIRLYAAWYTAILNCSLGMMMRLQKVGHGKNLKYASSITLCFTDSWHLFPDSIGCINGLFTTATLMMFSSEFFMKLNVFGETAHWLAALACRKLQLTLNHLASAFARVSATVCLPMSDIWVLMSG